MRRLVVEVFAITWGMEHGLPEFLHLDSRQISITCGRESGSAEGSNVFGDGREVSRSHSTSGVNRGAGKRPFKQRNPQARTDVKQVACAMRSALHSPTALLRIRMLGGVGGGS